eukprot:TRINITY_DN42984_c0_g1_i1.p1 TRINITY_DN42984_c0_g1~~TRINITY_DN42984_c0_g1_i1.p1  ORF type:complete len:161 (+),score=25.56 TRINITY_DN42984_c0_g1_i1:110-592(+)
MSSEGKPERYVPGRGLCKASTDRLRERQDERRRGERSDLERELPGEADDEQANMLLGNGAKKVMRCGVCTKPLDQDAVAAKKFVCSRCSGDAPPQTEAEKWGRQRPRLAAWGDERRRSRSRSRSPPGRRTKKRLSLPEPEPWRQGPRGRGSSGYSRAWDD